MITRSEFPMENGNHKPVVFPPDSEGDLELLIKNYDDYLSTWLTREQAFTLSQLLVALYSPAGDPT